MKARGLYWCQHLLGIGHLVRGMNVCKSLIEHFDIDFLQGGPQDIDLSIQSPNFKHLMLPSLANFPTGGVRDPQGRYSFNEILEQRKEFIKKNLTENYAFFICETFPFGKFPFLSEILEIIQHVKKKNPRCLIISACRDCVAVKEQQIVQAMVELIKDYFDGVLVHSDSKIIQLEETFPRSCEFADKVLYTGIVTSPKKIDFKVKREKRIVVSIGSGVVGEDFVKAVASVNTFFPNYEFIFSLGPRSPPSLKKVLETMQQAILPSNIKIFSFLNDFEDILQQCALSLSFAGYNTVADLLHTRTPALVYPLLSMVNPEQEIRAKKFAERGFLRVLSQEDLKPQRLSKIMREALEMPYPSLEINLNGAERTAHEISRLLNLLSGK